MASNLFAFHKLVFNLYSRIAFLLSTMQFVRQQYKDGKKRSEMLLLTVAFNDERLIEKQIEQIRSMIRDTDYQHVVVDNSLNKKKREAVKAVCKQYGIEYIQIPYLITRLFHYQIAVSHGAALNWFFYHYLREKSPKRFSLLDHDIFPLRDFNMTLTLGHRDFYGVSRIKEGEWYLWPGFCIYNFDTFPTEPDFLPRYTKKNFLDTGGGNYRKFYCNYNLKDVAFPEVKTVRIKNSKELARRCDIYHSDYVQIVDDTWLHLINGSNYANIKGKDDVIEKTLADVGSFYKEIMS